MMIAMVMMIVTMILIVIMYPWLAMPYHLVYQ